MSIFGLGLVFWWLVMKRVTTANFNFETASTLFKETEQLLAYKSLSSRIAFLYLAARSLALIYKAFKSKGVKKCFHDYFSANVKSVHTPNIFRRRSGSKYEVCLGKSKNVNKSLRASDFSRLFLIPLLPFRSRYWDCK